MVNRIDERLLEMMKLSNKEQERYSRHILLSEIGEAGQLKLKQSKVLVIGAGGLGIPVLQYLAAAGIGKVGIVDGDVIELSNLQRQVLYSESEVGQLKAEIAKEKLLQLNPEIEIVSFPVFLSSENAFEIFSGYEIIIDGSDNFPCRYLVNDACVKMSKPFVSGSVFKFGGQVGVFNFQGSGTYRCLFPEPPAPGAQPNCDEIGVLGVVPGTIGMMMANEAIKIICGIGQVLSDRILTADFLQCKFQSYSFQRDEEAVRVVATSPLPDQDAYQNFCNGGADELPVKEISSSELQRMIDEHTDFQLIDVRELFEREEKNIGGDFIPFAEVMSNEDKISREKKVIFYCKVGMRSHIIIQRLQEKYGLKNLYNLKGGITAFIGNRVTLSNTD